MIEARDLHRWSIDPIASGRRNEPDLRRAVSGLYYGLFHRIAGDAAVLFTPAASVLHSRLLSSFDHRQLKKVCVAYTQWSERDGQAGVEMFREIGRDRWLTLLSRALARLQETRHHADYDLNRELGRGYAEELLELAEAGHWSIDELAGSDRIRSFFVILLLGDKLTPRA